jgi:DNA-directed RNA polymerase specialized sigma24 family protein
VRAEAILILRALRSAEDGRLTDGQALAKFIANRDEAAFDLLARRHAEMAYGVYRRLAGNVSDPEDAFRATFLVLMRKAESIL